MNTIHNSSTEAVEVAAGLVFRDGKLLITQRRTHDHLGGFWEFPGGKRECSESFERCLERELKEELGIDIEAGELLETITHAYPEKTVHLRFFRCTWRAHEPKALACQGFAWITRQELDSYTFPAADECLVQHLKNRPELWM